MSTERPRHEDTGPFASLTHELVYGGPGPQEHDFHMCDRDVSLYVEAGNRTLCLLHLQNVRTDTVAEARAAVDDFLGQLDSTSHPKRVEHTVFENFDKVRQELREHVGATRADVEDLYDELNWVEGNSAKRTADATHEKPGKDSPDLGGDNTLATVRAACETFLEKLKLVDDSNEPCKRQAHTMHANDDDSHLEICEYMEAQAEKGGFNFEWSDGCYPRDMLRRTGSRIRYDVYFQQNGSWGTHYGTR